MLAEEFIQVEPATMACARLYQNLQKRGYISGQNSFYILPQRIYSNDIIYDNDQLVQFFFGDPAGTSSNFKMGVMKSDTNGTIAWAKLYDIPSGTTDQAVKILKMSYGYALVGYYTGSRNDLFVIAIDPQGTILWAKSYGEPGAAENIRLHHANMAIAVGDDILLAAAKGPAGNQNVIIARIDSNGNTSCITPVDLQVTTANAPNSTFDCPVRFFPDNVSSASFTNIRSSLFPSVNCISCKTDLGPDRTVCGEPVTLDATTAGATQYIWSDGSTSPTLTVTQTGKYWVDIYIDCCVYTDTVLITSSPRPEAVFGLANDSTICGSAAQFTNSSTHADTYRWDFGDNTPLLEAVAPTHTWSPPGSYTVTLFASNSCGTDTFTRSVDIVDIPVTAQFEVSVDSCSNAPVAFTSTSVGAASIVWDFGDNSVPSVSGFVVHAYPEPGTYLVRLVATNSCHSDTATRAITIDSLPSLNLNSRINSCETAVINATGLFNEITWLNGLTKDSILVSDPGIYWAEARIGQCSVTDSITVQITSKPQVPIVSGDSSFCENDLLNLSADSHQQFSARWLFADGHLIEGLHTGTLRATPAQNGDVAIWLQDGGCSSDTGYYPISIYNLPALSLGPDRTSCDTAISIKANGTYDELLWWNGTGEPDSITVSEPGLYWAEARIGHCKTTDSVAIEILSRPLAPVVSGDSSFCENDLLNLTATGDQQFLTRWLFADGTLFEGQQTGTLRAVPAQSGMIATWMEQGECNSDTTFHPVQVHANPEIDLGSDIDTCGTEVLLAASGNFDAVSWSTSDTTFSIVVGTTGIYYATAYINTCFASDTVAVSIFPVPSSPPVSGAVHYCPPGNVLLYTPVQEDALITWKVPGDSSISGDTLHYIPGPGETGFYIYVSQVINNCVSPNDSVFITIFPESNITYTAPSTICTGDSGLFVLTGQYSHVSWNGIPVTDSSFLAPAGDIHLTVIDTNGCSTDTLIIIAETKPEAGFSLSPEFLLVGQPVRFEDESVSAFPIIQHDWFFPENATAQGKIVEYASPFPGEKEVSLVVTDELGCKDTLTLGYKVFELVIPNVISPNGDGVNDVFTIEALPALENPGLIIFNRWGQQLFEAFPYLNNWDGGNFPDGTYFYIFTYNDQQVLKGTLSILGLGN